MKDREVGWPALSIADAHASLTAPGARFEMETRLIRGVPTRVWKNAPASLREVFTKLEEYSERTCLVYEDERVTYAAFMRATRALALQLQAAGVRPGERVAIAMRNLPEWPVIMFAAALIGAIVVPCNAWGTGAELAYALQISGATVLFADGERLGRVAQSIEGSSQLRAIIVTRAAPAPGVQVLQDLIGTSARWEQLPDHPLPDVALDPDGDAMIFFTSGTTGKPKGAVCTQRNVCSNTFTTACAQARAALRRGQPPAPPPGPSSPQRSLLLAVPLFHVMGCMPWLVAGLYNGSKLVLMHKWDATRALELIERERVTQAGGVPMMAAQLLEHPERERYDLSSIESISMGGAPAAKVIA